MSKVVIEQFSADGGRWTVDVVFSTDPPYSETWLRNSHGQVTVPYVELAQMLADDLESRGKLRSGFKEAYRRTTEDALVRKLTEIGKTEGARERAQKRAKELTDAIRDIRITDHKPRSTKKTLRKWWRLNGFYVYASVIFVLLAGSIVWGMLYVQHQLEQPEAAPSGIEVVADSTACAPDSAHSAKDSLKMHTDSPNH